MEQLTVKLVNGIMNRLRSVFGDTYSVYTEEAEQEFIKPCFLLTVLPEGCRPFLGSRRQLQNKAEIRFYPEPASGQETALQEAAGKLMKEMEWIELPDGDLIRGTKMASEKKNNLLYFTVHYNLVVTETREQELLGGIKTRIDTKE
ncbi:phage tail terminator family protein [Anaerolentibacter hominis]|uniref:phage tail terminator family protein n=1 Tax=Anaerolentibacter hominis TaxID=3079009 RepID=UPI0031B89F7E